MKKFTKEQELFFQKLQLLKHTSNIEAQKLIRLELWKLIERYALYKLKQLSSYIDLKDKEDIIQDLALIFFEKLPDYNPCISAPTTYFSAYFKQVIMCPKNSNLTLYDLKNKRKIERAKESIIQDDGVISIKEIAHRSGLSEKVVISTLKIIRNIRDMDSVYESASYLEEDRILDKIYMDDLMQNITTYATVREKEALLKRINLHESKMKSYEDVASEMNISTRQVKNLLNNICVKMEIKMK